MFGIRFIKFQPSQYVLKYKNGKLVREGAGLAFFYAAARTALVVVPSGGIDVPFIFEEKTADYQTVSVQGQLVYRIADPKTLAGRMDYAYVVQGAAGRYASDDPEKLSQRLVNNVKVLTRKYLERLELHAAVRAGEEMALSIREELQGGGEVRELGIEVTGLSILAVTAGKETARALEAGTREAILQKADDALYGRRNASIEQERRVRENEYNTEISEENKKREVRQAQLEAEEAVQQMNNRLRAEQLEFEIGLEEKRRELIALAVENRKAEADAEAYALSAVMRALDGVPPQVVQALAAVGMKPRQLMAQAFQGLAGNAEKIGQLTITPDLLSDIAGAGRGA